MSRESPVILKHMNEQSLYRKYRPSTWKDVRGQDEIIATLEQSVATKSFSHAYMFSGGRGTGKTTVARLFAASVGCLPVDLYEIDGASNRKIEHVRDLREAVRTMPFQSSYKVYIIDEVHMLTPEAFNALLKTLEEPPAHVIFILATTDLEKVPDTIISRCQSFVFRQPLAEELRAYAIEIAKKEGVSLDEPSAAIVAMFGDGSYRDTLSVLEKVLHSAEKGTLDSDTVARVVGAPTHDLIDRVLRAIEADDPSDGLQAIGSAKERHIDMKVYLSMLLAKMRAILLLRYAPSSAKELSREFTPDDLVLLGELANSPARRVNSHVLSAFLLAADRLGYSTLPSLPIELALIAVTAEKKK